MNLHSVFTQGLLKLDVEPSDIPLVLGTFVVIKYIVFSGFIALGVSIRPLAKVIDRSANWRKSALIRVRTRIQNTNRYQDAKIKFDQFTENNSKMFINQRANINEFIKQRETILANVSKIKFDKNKNPQLAKFQSVFKDIPTPQEANNTFNLIKERLAELRSTNNITGWKYKFGQLYKKYSIIASNALLKLPGFSSLKHTTVRRIAFGVGEGMILYKVLIFIHSPLTIYASVLLYRWNKKKKNITDTQPQ